LIINIIDPRFAECVEKLLAFELLADEVCDEWEFGEWEAGGVGFHSCKGVNERFQVPKRLQYFAW
jgi:hypothetical protein